MNIFPMVQPTVGVEPAELPMAREVGWDFVADRPIFHKGNPVIVEGAEAVAVWAWNALQTVRGRHEIFTRNYGNDTEKLIGQNFTGELKQAEAVRYLRECLLTNPYISDVREVQVSFFGDELNISCRITTIYGEVSLERRSGIVSR